MRYLTVVESNDFIIRTEAGDPVIMSQFVTSTQNAIQNMQEGLSVLEGQTLLARINELESMVSYLYSKIE